MELDLSVCIGLSALNVLVFGGMHDDEASFGRFGIRRYFTLTFISALSGLSGAFIGGAFIRYVPKVERMLPLLAPLIAVFFTVLIQKILPSRLTELITPELILMGVVLSVIWSFGSDTDSRGIYYIGLLADTAVYTISSGLIFSAATRLESKKGGIPLMQIILSASALGLAAEGFKGIFENLFT